MASRTPGDASSEPSHEVTLTDENTFRFLPGAMQGVSCPSCFHDQLLGELIREGECRSCGASVRVSLEVTE